MIRYRIENYRQVRAPNDVLGISVDNYKANALVLDNALVDASESGVFPRGSLTHDLPHRYSKNFFQSASVFLTGDDQLISGTAASLAGYYWPDRFATRFMRHLGTDTLIPLAGRFYPATDLLTAVLRTLREQAGRAMRMPISRTVISIPASYTRAQRESTFLSARAAGFTQVDLLEEPYAIIISRNPDRFSARLSLVYILEDTFRACLVRKLETGYEIIGEPVECADIGQLEFERLALQYLIDQLPSEFREMVDPANRERFGWLASSVFERFSNAALPEIHSRRSDRDGSVLVSPFGRIVVDWDQLASLFQSALNVAADRCVQMVRDAGLESQRIEEIVAVGSYLWVSEGAEKLIPRIKAGEISTSGWDYRGAAIYGARQAAFQTQASELAEDLERMRI